MADLSDEHFGIIAGGGQFPFIIARELRKRGLRSAICAFADNTDPALEKEADAFTMIYLGQVGKLLDFFHKHNVTKLCMAGSIKKPKALSLRPDMRAAKLFIRLREANKGGDDAILRLLAQELASEGISVVGAADLAPDLRGPAGVLTKRKPGKEEWADLNYAWPIGKTLGQYDIGQCLVARQGMVVAVEAIEGTNAALLRAAELAGAGCTALKTLKPGQDERLDLPSIGLDTVRLLIEKQYACLAYEAGHTLFFDREAAVAEADKHGLCIVGLTPELLQRP